MKEIKLQKPLDDFKVTQEFGKNFNSYYAEAGMLGHNGIDFACEIGTPIYASHDGVCMGISEDSAGGIGIDIRAGKIDNHDDTFKTRYWHIMKGGVMIKYGQEVKAGELIALSGNTGRSTGPHLHFGLKRITFKDGVWINQDQDNKYKGGIDPMPYLDVPFYLKFGEVKYGYVNIGVSILQALLMSKGYSIKVDGEFGRKTLSVVKEYQKANGLVVDGIAGIKTFTSLLSNQK